MGAGRTERTGDAVRERAEVAPAMTWAGARIHLCGALRAELEGERREDRLHGRQGRLLFAFLILRRHRPVTRDELVEAVWGHGGVPPSEGALAPVLSRLRRAIAPAAVEGRDGLLLHLPEPTWIDIEAARSALSRARGTQADEEKLDTAREAAALVEPGLLPGLEAPWLADERVALDHLRVEALELAAQAALGLDPPLAETLARTAVAASPFRESAWVTLICALRARGNVAEALQAYDEIRRLLRDELGAVPGRELVTLHGQLLAAEEGANPEIPLRPRADAPRAGRRAGAGGELIEREEELRAVEGALDRLAAGQGGLILFEGPAGIGKTRLLDELRARAEARQTVVLHARAGLLEREFAFGVVRQLFEAVADPGRLEGPAAAARAVL